MPQRRNVAIGSNQKIRNGLTFKEQKLLRLKKSILQLLENMQNKNNNSTNVSNAGNNIIWNIKSAPGCQALLPTDDFDYFYEIRQIITANNRGIIVLVNELVGAPGILSILQRLDKRYLQILEISLDQRQKNRKILVNDTTTGEESDEESDTEVDEEQQINISRRNVDESEIIDDEDEDFEENDIRFNRNDNNGLVSISRSKSPESLTISLNITKVSIFFTLYHIT